MSHKLYYTKADGDPGELVFTNTLAAFLTTDAPPEIRRLFGDALEQLRWSRVKTSLGLVMRPGGNDVPMNYFSIRKGEEPVVSYLPFGKLHVTGADGSWSRENRQSMRPGKWLRGLFTPAHLANYNITDSVVEAFSNGVKSFVDDSTNIQLVRGTDIVKYYRSDSYTPYAGSTLGNSCMRHTSLPRSTFDVYSKNKNCSMLIALDKQGKLIARALVWSNVQFKGHKLSNTAATIEETITFMDRVYYHHDYLEQTFVEYAAAQGWWRRPCLDGERGTAINPQGAPYTGRMDTETGMVEKDRPNHGPYADTMNYFSINLDRIGNHYGNMPDGYYALSNTGGSISIAADHRGWVVTDLHGRVHQSNLGTCPACNRSGNRNNFVYVTDGNRNLCEECLKKEFEYSKSTAKWILKKNAIAIIGTDGRPDFASRSNVVVSRYHAGKIAKSKAVFNLYYKDWLYTNVSMVQSKKLGVYVIKDQATYVAELADYIPNDKLSDYADEIAALRKAAEEKRKEMMERFKTTGQAEFDPSLQYKAIRDGAGAWHLVPAEIAATMTSATASTRAR